MEGWAEFILQEEDMITKSPEYWLHCFRRDFPYYRSAWVARLLNICMEEMMARGKTSTRGNTKAVSAYGTEFVNFTLPADEVPMMQEVYRDEEVVWKELGDLLTSGYRMSVSYNVERTSYIVSLTCRAEGMPNDGCTMTSFAGAWFVALQVALYKHNHLLHGDWSSVRGAGGGQSIG